MYTKKECVAMLLAGGQGSRLYALTQDMAKPAVPFGGKYRLIDFPLSNCVNSGIDTVGVLTQYQPLVLHDYLGNGQPWDLDHMNGGVHALPPYQNINGASWYSGSANAIYQNISFIDRYNPTYVVVLSGDHVYKMDYNKMLDCHKAKNADCTIPVLDVPLEEASRFGIMTANAEGIITKFEEKPKNPESTLASMGIYIFNWDKLRKALIENENDQSQEKDFGKNIIPNMLADGCVMVAYPFEDYWKDVGTLDSLWDANMDLLNPKIPIDLYDPNWKIYSRNPILPPQYIGADAFVENCMVTDGCEIEGECEFSVIFEGVKVGKGAKVGYSIIMPGTVIEDGAVVEYAIIGENCKIGKNAHIGTDPTAASNRDDWGIAVVGHNLSISEGKAVLPKEIISESV
jgi:glucose-1-phosphate adenylyltransferase